MRERIESEHRFISRCEEKPRRKGTHYYQVRNMHAFTAITTMYLRHREPRVRGTILKVLEQGKGKEGWGKG
jgi:hypothetical protein